MSDDDLATRRLRSKLVSAFRDLTSNSDVVDVPVEDLVAAAGVSRSAFYSIFSDIPDVAVAALIEEFNLVATMDFTRQVENTASPEEIIEGSLSEIIDFIAERRSLYRDLLVHQGRHYVALEDALAANGLNILLARGDAGAHPEVAARSMACGTIGIYAWWLRDNPDVSREELTAAMTATIPTVYATRLDGGRVDS